MAQKVLRYLFYLLFAATPLIWLSFTSELFEWNKMYFVYLLSTLIVTTWLFRMIEENRLILKRSPLDIPLILFLISQIISTIFSIDQHVSIFGYYSRLNGGLLSTISYITLYYALISNFEKEDVVKFLKASLFGGLLVSLYAIPEHFGVSPSCLILTNRADANCWVQLVQERVFATLGQPNWLAGYLGILIFPALYFALTAQTFKQKAIYYLLATIYYLAFTFTYTRGTTIGLWVGLVVFTIILFCHPERSAGSRANARTYLKQVQRFFGYRLRMTLLMVVTFIGINLLFGSALTNFSLVRSYQAPTRGSLVDAVSGTQLENGGTESGKIRFIVWQGAIDIFKRYPIFGTGVETFAYSYYQYRPKEHNLTTEWDFLYNKAHNEFLNYLATTGAVGFISYMSIIVGFMVYSIWFIVLKKLSKDKTIDHQLLTIAIASAYITILIHNFFLFSIVVTALLFYLLPAMLFIYNSSTKEIKRNFKSIYPKALIAMVLIVATSIMITLLRFWYADVLYNKGSVSNQKSNPGKAYNYLVDAYNLNPKQPLYESELAFTAASASVASFNTDATLSAKLKDQAVLQTEHVLNSHPKNVSFFRTAIRAYYLLSTVFPEFEQKTLEVLDKAISLAPTDPKLPYNRAIILGSSDKIDEAIAGLEKTITIKPNYRDAHYALGLMYYQKSQKEKSREKEYLTKAVDQMKECLKTVPEDGEAQEKLKLWLQ